MTRRPRRTIAVVGGLVILLAAVAVVAYLAGRTNEPTAAPTPPSTPTAGVGPGEPSTQPSPASSTAGASNGLATGAVTAGQGGSTKGPSGLPLGYPHTKDGAVAAATNYLTWMDSIKITKKSDADAMAAATAADQQTRSALVQSFDETRSGMDGLTNDQLEPARGAYAVAHYSPDSGTVYVWAPEVATDKSGETQHLWAIDAVDVVWANGDWKLNHELIARTGGAAVDPKDPTGNPPASEKRSILMRTPADPGEIEDSADQAWFEYANAPH
jgi:hypothetical protein